MTLSWSLKTFETLESTQDVVRGHAAMEAPEGIVVQALTQTAGRGRAGRNWVSLPGNLHMSILLRPACDARRLGEISLLSAVALAEAIETSLKTPDAVQLKWPNDVLIGVDKCAGLLLESDMTARGSLNWLIVGMGVNVALAPPGLGTSIQAHTSAPLDLSVFRERVLSCFDTCYAQWSREGFEPIRLAWLARAQSLGSAIQVKNGTYIERGVFEGIDQNGNMILRGADLGLKVVSAGEIFQS